MTLQWSTQVSCDDSTNYFARKDPVTISPCTDVRARCGVPTKRAIDNGMEHTCISIDQVEAMLQQVTLVLTTELLMVLTIGILKALSKILLICAGYRVFIPIAW